MKKLFQKIMTNTFYKTYCLILLPMSILILFLLFSSLSYNKSYKELLKENYSFKLESMFHENETSIQSIINSIHLLSKNDSFMSYIINNETFLNIKDTSYAIGLLKQLKKSDDMIDSIAIINREENEVITSNSNNLMEKYFYEAYRYYDYNIDFWKYYKSPLTDVQWLSPTTVNEWTVEKSIMPIVFTQIGDIKISNLLILNIDIKVIIQKAQEKRLTKNSNIIIINKQTGQCFDSDGVSIKSTDKMFYENIVYGNHNIFEFIDKNGKKELVISYSPSKSLLGYSYAVTIPYSDINQRLSRTMIIILIMGIMSIIAIFFISYISAQKIYSPLKNLASLFKNKKGIPQNLNQSTIDYIHSSILDTINNNIDLTNEFSMALPLIQEKYLIHLLNSDEYYLDANLDEILLKNKVQFKYDYFSSIVIKLRLTDIFYDTYNNIEYNLIQTGIYNIIKSIFNVQYDAFIVSSENNTLYVLLNLEDDKQKENIIDMLNNLVTLFDNDKEYIKLCIGLGGIYKNIDGLKRSHNEAINSVSAIAGLNQVKIHSYEPTTKTTNYTFSINDENNLLHYLITGYIDDAKELINHTISENIESNISEHSMIQLHIQIINIIFKVMRIKNIPYDETDRGDFSIITDIISCPLEEIHDTIIKLVDKIADCMEDSITKVDIQSAIEYINNNFKEDLYLDLLAEKFNTTSKYMSKLIKDKLGINFIDYLAKLRINQAKILLSDTNKSIEKIYTHIGFNNRNTFTRTFKKIVGITPTEYRRINSK